MNQIRLHIKLGDKRTTISADEMLVAMLAIKLGHDPNNAAQVAREWLQARLPEKVGTDKGIGKRTSQAARELLIEAIADKKVSARYDEWAISGQ